MYSVSAKYFNKLMTNCLITKYKVSDGNIIDQTNNDSQEIISSKYFKLKNKKIPKFSKVDAFLTVKDHKKTFPLNIECRTTNPRKNSLGKLSKNILENIVFKI